MSDETPTQMYAGRICDRKGRVLARAFGTSREEVAGFLFARRPLALRVSTSRAAKLDDTGKFFDTGLDIRWIRRDQGGEGK